MMTDQVSKPAMFDNLRSLLNDIFKLRRQGAAHAQLARQQGYVDGYMRLLLESGIATRSELLDLVSAERVRADGPATAAVTVDPTESEVAA